MGRATRRPLVGYAAVALLASAAAGSAAAQVPAEQPAAPSAAPPERMAPPIGQEGGGDLSDRLEESGGVIAPPPGQDPEMVQPAPPTGSPMPVIPPEAVPPGGSPGQ